MNRLPRNWTARYMFFQDHWNDSLFLERSRHQRNLHSFPTRRSSDLDSLPLSKRNFQSNYGSEKWPLICDLRLARSEEHTSELQSRLHLVCRLLLEKKKSISSKYFLADRTRKARSR